MESQDQDFWLALLEILSADSAQQRGEKLAELVEAALKQRMDGGSGELVGYDGYACFI